MKLSDSTAARSGLEYKEARQGFQLSLRSGNVTSNHFPAGVGTASAIHSPGMIRYRPNVAVILRHPDGRILIGERNDLPGVWQFPQGGIVPGETPDEALVREIREEISLEPCDYQVVGRRGPYRYEFPEGLTKRGFGGQEQMYFLADFVGDENRILTATEEPEFRATQWIAPEHFPLDAAAPMKRMVYRAVLRDFFGIDFGGGRTEQRGEFG